MEEVQPGSTILVYVSKGSEVEDIEMLDFVGQNIQDAKVQCGVWGLTVKTKKQDSGEEEGTILKQSIKEGEKGSFGFYNYVYCKYRQRTGRRC